MHTTVTQITKAAPAMTIMTISSATTAENTGPFNVLRVLCFKHNED